MSLGYKNVVSESVSTYQKLAEDHLYIVYSIAKSIIKKCPPVVLMEDLVGAGIVGLLESAERYDESFSVEFKAYAEHRVRGAMLDELRKMDVVSRDARKLDKKINKSIENLKKRTGFHPSDEDIAKDVGIEESELQDHYKKMLYSTVSDMGFFEIDHISDENALNILSVLETEDQKKKLRHILSSFDQKTQSILQLYYVEKTTLKNIGEIFSVTESRVCQILHKTLFEIRKMMQEKE
jgi:RNA polymerase sigma factor for flagellar operon FliA